MAIRLKSRHQCPPGGFEFKQKETGWFLQSWDFNLLCAELQKHRQANPQFKLNNNLQAIQDEVDEANALRVLAIPNAESYVNLGAGVSPPITVLPQQLRLRRGNAAAGSNIKSGAELLIDWLGAGGKPVDKSLAENRASICATCPQNGKGDLTRFFTVPLSEAIRKTVAIKNDLALKTSSDEQLNVCEACSCPLKLKVWVGLDFIKAHVAPVVLQELDPRCWMLNEK